MAVFCSERLPKEWSQPHHTAPRQWASLRNPQCRVQHTPGTQEPRQGGREGNLREPQ